MDINFTWKEKERSFSFCPYTAFGIAAFVVFISLMMAVCGTMIYTDPEPPTGVVANFICILISCWVSGLIMVNLGEPKASPAVNFWVGPVFCIVVHVLGFFGLGLIWLFV